MLVVYPSERALSTGQQDARLRYPSLQYAVVTYVSCSEEPQKAFAQQCMVPFKIPGQACHKQKISLNRMPCSKCTEHPTSSRARTCCRTSTTSTQQSLHPSPREWVRVVSELGSRHEATIAASLLLNNTGACRLKCESLTGPEHSSPASSTPSLKPAA